MFYIKPACIGQLESCLPPGRGVVGMFIREKIYLNKNKVNVINKITYAIIFT